MHVTLRLAPLFLGILTTLPACPLFGGCDTFILTTTYEVAPAALEAALADGELGQDECAMLCRYQEPTTGEQPTTSVGTSSTTDASTGTTDASTGPDSTSTDASTGPGSTSTTSTSTTSTGTTGDPLASDVISCKAIDGMPNMVSCDVLTTCVGGRRPAGLRSSAACAPGAVGEWFAATAHLEAASVPAFERLLAELQAHGAPEALLQASLAAADDERRHARAMTAMAGRHGAAVVAVELEPARPRELLALALENAVEGCVQETWAALLAAHQAESADDPEVRVLMAEIAADETRHAELAWAIDAWLRTRLSADEQRQVDAARAAAALGVQPQAELPHAWIRGLGLPARTRAEPMWRALNAALWAA